MSARHRSPKVLVGLLVIAVLAAFAWMTTSVSRRVGITYDELGHIVSGYGYWTFSDYRVNAENGVLATRSSAAPLLPLNLKFPSRESAFWKDCHARALGHEFFFYVGNDFETILRRARLGTIGFGLGLLWLIWRWSARLFGRGAGFVALGSAAFSPTLLSHSGLATSDVILSFWLLAALTAWWRFWHVVTWTRLLLAGVAAGLAFTAKMSGVVLVPMLAFLVVLRCIHPAPLVVRLGPGSVWLRTRTSKAAAVVLASFAAAGISVAVIWACYGFRFTAVPDADAAGLKFIAPWSALLQPAPQSSATTLDQNASEADRGPRTDFPRTVVAWAREHRVLPEAFLWGFAYTYHSLHERESFLNGEISRRGSPWFFPLAFLLKTTPAEIALFGLGILALALIRPGQTTRKPRNVRWLYRGAPLVVLLIVYWAVAVRTPLNIGHRHLLPVYPVLFVLAGAVVFWRPLLRRTGFTLLVFALLGWQMVESVAARPFYLSYFTPFVGGAREGWRHLVDSSFDWGQGLPDFAAWLKAKESSGDRSTVFLTYFGSDSPRARQLAVTRFADARDDHGARRFPHLTGGWYAISATYYQKVYLDLAGPWSETFERDYVDIGRQLRVDATVAATYTEEQRAHLRDIAKRYEVLQFGRLRHYLGDLNPIAIVGSSILLFRLSDDDIRLALDVPLAELNAHLQNRHR